MSKLLPGNDELNLTQILTVEFNDLLWRAVKVLLIIIYTCSDTLATVNTYLT